MGTGSEWNTRIKLNNKAYFECFRKNKMNKTHTEHT